MRIGPSTLSGRLQRAFTMVEIAISLGVIGFALVAIVGILPRGLNAQRENRQDTIVNQDGAYLLEVMRGGIRGLDDLTNYVDYIVVTSSKGTTTRTVWAVPRPDQTVVANWPLTNGQTVATLMSIPKYTAPFTTNFNGTNVIDVACTTNTVSVYMWAMSGSALEQGFNRAVAFKYKVTPQITPFAGYGYEMTNFSRTAPSDELESIENAERSNNWHQVRQLTNNLCEVLLRVEWPLRPNDEVSPNRTYQIFRTFVNGHESGVIEPQKYTVVP